MKAISNVDVRLKNYHNVYHTIYNAPDGITLKEIGAALHLSLPTVNTCIAHLLGENLIEYGSLEDSTGGRKPRTITIHKNAKYAIGIATSKHHVRLMLSNLRGETIAFEKHNISFVYHKKYFTMLNDMVMELLRVHSINHAQVLGIGVSIAGLVTDDGELITAPTLQIKNKNLKSMLSCFHFPVRFINDASAAGIAEWWHSDKAKHFCCLYIESGIGGAIIINGSPYNGNRGRSGEFGHMCIAEHSPVCSCGKEGCFEALCSADRLSQDFGIDLDAFFTACPDNAEYTAVLNRYLCNLAKGIANIHTLFDTDLCVSGFIVPYLIPYEEKLKQYIQKQMLVSETPSFLRFSKIPNRSAALGAALQWMNEFLKNIN
ncbi:MAG: ROK family transcriptional regulator [Eubacteriales bacterium]|nr:ROK family transcriptional regulator [Eubacteriales bacterium]